MTIPIIERAFLTLPGRQVHYRRGGSGPAVILLHQSPKSSEELVPLMELLAPHFTVLAPDRPGYGLSDPILPPDEEPEIDVFVDAVAEFMDGLGLQKAGFYGIHTGAAIATRFALRYPARVQALVANGTLIMTAEERADFLANYLTAFTPTWDGGHLAWLWSRMEEQSIFFPWHKRDPAARMVYGLNWNGVQANTMAFLESGDNYRTAYRGALAHEKEQDLVHLKVPARFVCAETDVLYPYLVRFPELPHDVSIERVADAKAVDDFTLSFLTERVKADTPELPAQTLAPARRIGSALIRTSYGQIHIRGNMNASGRTILALHDAGSSARALQSILGGFSGRRPIVAPDLPGHGDSDPLATPDGDIIATYAKCLAELLDRLKIDSVDIVSVGAGATVALAFAEQYPDRVANLAICNPFIVPPDRADEFAAEYVPSLATEWSGAHLLRAWHFAREQDLFWPWFDKSAAAVLPQAIPASPQKIQKRVVDLFKAAGIHAAYIGEIARDPLPAKLEKTAIPAHLFANPGSPARSALEDIIPIAPLPGNEIGWAAIILEALG